MLVDRKFSTTPPKWKSEIDKQLFKQNKDKKTVDQK